MDFLKGKIRPIYFRYLAAAFGSAMITSVYSVVDTAMVGQYHGPDSTAALAVVAPVWNIIYSLGLLMGIGGSVIFSTKRGSARPDGSENPYFTVSVLGSLGLALLAWAGLLWLEGPILTFLGPTRGCWCWPAAMPWGMAGAAATRGCSCSIRCWRRFSYRWPGDWSSAAFSF